MKFEKEGWMYDTRRCVPPAPPRGRWVGGAMLVLMLAVTGLTFGAVKLWPRLRAELTPRTTPRTERVSVEPPPAAPLQGTPPPPASAEPALGIADPEVREVLRRHGYDPSDLRPPWRKD